MQNKIIYILLSVALFFGGYWLRGYLHTCPAKVVTKVEYVDRVQTEIAYVPKETIIYKDGSSGVEETDIDMQLGKPDLNVKVNGKDFVISKQEDEKYIFDKNKLTLTQNSSAELHISVPVVDKAKRWGIGAGVSKEGAVGFLRFPVRDNVGGWIAGNEKTAMGGVEVRF